MSLLQTYKPKILGILHHWEDDLIGALPGTQLLERYRPSKTVLINVNKCNIRSQSRYYMNLLANLNSSKPKGHSLGYNYNGK